MIPLRTNVHLHSGIISRLNIARYKTKHYKKIYYVSAYEAMTKECYKYYNNKTQNKSRRKRKIKEKTNGI